jgi:hypothetical protein
MRPYTDLEVTDKYIIREFTENIDPIELMWHRDDEDRTVEPLCPSDWQFQRDNEMPILLKEGERIFIKKHEWHRVIKGSGDLLIKIYKHGKEEAY